MTGSTEFMLSTPTMMNEIKIVLIMAVTACSEIMLGFLFVMNMDYRMKAITADMTMRIRL
jgi:hypothetical protein